MSVLCILLKLADLWVGMCMFSLFQLIRHVLACVCVFIQCVAVGIRVRNSSKVVLILYLFVCWYVCIVLFVSWHVRVKLEHDN